MIAEETLRARLPSSHLPSRKALPPFEALRAFDAIARLGGVRKAAQYLCRDHAVVSRHLRAIEEWTGTKLIERTPGGAVLTEDGVRYHSEVGSRDGPHRRRDRRPDEARRQSSPAHSLHARLRAALAVGPPRRFREGQPRPRRRGAARRPQAGLPVSGHRPRDPTGADLRAAPQLPSEPAHHRDSRTCRSSRWRARSTWPNHPPIAEPRDLLSHQLLHEENFDRWRNFLAAHGVVDDVELTGPRLWQGHLTLDAARYGRGVSLTNMLIAADDIAAGRLVEVGRDLRELPAEGDGYLSLHRQGGPLGFGLIRRFRHWLVSTIAREHPAFKAEEASRD